MAIYCFIMKVIGGNSRRSAVGAAAYRAGEKLYNERFDKTHNFINRRGAIGAAAYRSGEKLNAYDFTRKGEIIHNETILPKHAPEIYLVRSVLWNSAEKAERNHNARTAKEIVVALPNELTPQQQIELVRDFVQRNFVDEGMCADFSIHAGHIHERKGEIYPFEGLTIQRQNPHAHIQLTVRPINKDGTWGSKSKKEYILDKNGNKIKLPSGEWKSRKVDANDWNKTETLLKWREDWARTINKEFERLGIDERIDHRSLKEQGIDREPTIHMGHKAWNLEKKGIKTERGNMNREIMARNRARVSEFTPEVKAENLHELKQSYITADMKCAVIKQKISDVGREKAILHDKVEEIEERAEHIRSLKNRIDEMRTKRQDTSMLSRSHEQAVSYFKRIYHISPEESKTKIYQLESQAHDLAIAVKSLQDKLPPLLVDMETFKHEYHVQKILTDVHHDRQRIFYRLEQLEKETQGKLSPKSLIAYTQSEANLDKVSEQEFEKILQDMLPEYREIFIRERERVRERDRDRSR